MVAQPAAMANHTTLLRIQPTWRALVAFGLGTRLCVVVLGCLLALPVSSVKSPAARSQHNDGMNPRHLAALSSGSRRWIEPWYRWDAMWYLDISERGYSYRPGVWSSVAFLPLLPLLVKLGTTAGLDPYWLGLLIPNLAFARGPGSLRSYCAPGDRKRRDDMVRLHPAGCVSHFLLLFRSLSRVALPRAFGRCALGLARAPAGALRGGARGRIGRAIDGAVDVARAGPGMGDRHLEGPARPPWGVVGRHRGHAGDSLLLRLPGAAISRSALALEGARRLAAKVAHRRSTSGGNLVTLPLVGGHGPEIGGLHAVARVARWRGCATGRWFRPIVVSRAAGSSPDRRHSAGGSQALLTQAPRHGRSRAGGALVRHRPLAWRGAAGWTDDVVSTLHMVAYSRDLLATILFLGLGIHAFVKRGPLWGCLVLVPVLQALASGSILSMTRVVLSSYPAFVDAAEIASNRAVFAITVVVCLFAQFVLLTSYVNWIFVA